MPRRDLGNSLTQHVTHTFLIRAPAEIAASCYALQGQRLTLPEIGLEHAYDLYQAILATGALTRSSWTLTT